MTDAERNLYQKYEPPWVAFPRMKSEDLGGNLKQGAQPWFDHFWTPFWNGLTREQREEYLGFWSASLDWREEIKFYFETLYEEDLDLEEEARESEECLRQYREQRERERNCRWLSKAKRAVTEMFRKSK